MKIHNFIMFCIDFKLNNTKGKGLSPKEVFMATVDKDGKMSFEDFTLTLEMIAMGLSHTNPDLLTMEHKLTELWNHMKEINPNLFKQLPDSN